MPLITFLTISLSQLKGPLLHWLERESMAYRPGKAGQGRPAVDCQASYMYHGEKSVLFRYSFTHKFVFTTITLFVLTLLHPKPSPSWFDSISFAPNAQYKRGLRLYSSDEIIDSTFLKEIRIWNIHMT